MNMMEGQGNSASNHVFEQNMLYLNDIINAMTSGGFIVVSSIFKGIDSGFCDLVCSCTRDELKLLAGKLPPLVNLEQNVA